MIGQILGICGLPGTDPVFAPCADSPAQCCCRGVTRRSPFQRSLLARARAELADHGGTLRLVGVALPEFLAALTAAPLDEVFLVYDTVREHAAGDGATRRKQRPTSSVQRCADWPS